MSLCFLVYNACNLAPRGFFVGERGGGENMNLIKKIAISISTLLALTSFAAPAFAANTTVVVRAGDLETSTDKVVAASHDKWFMYNDTNDTIDNSLGSFVNGPATPIHGVGSIEFTLGANPNDRKNIATYQFRGTALSSITAMSYGAYSHSGVAGANESPFFNFNVDFTGNSTTWQRRLVYVPANNGAVTQDAWNTFDMINGGNAMWVYSGALWPAGGSETGTTPGTTPKTWNSILADYPDIRVLPTDSWLGIRVGEPGPTGYTGNVDFFSITKGGDTTVFDFEPTPVLVGPPVHKDECRDGGWQTFNNPTFKNQGKCIDYVNHHNHIVRGNNAQYQAYGLNREANFDMETANNKGNFHYTDGNKNKYSVKVSEVKVDGNTAWFAGEVISSKNNAYDGQWLFAKVVDNGASGDLIWGSFVADETTAKADVAAMSDPSDGSFTLFKGNIKVN